MWVAFLGATDFEAFLALEDALVEFRGDVTSAVADVLGGEEEDKVGHVGEALDGDLP